MERERVAFVKEIESTLKINTLGFCALNLTHSQKAHETIQNHQNNWDFNVVIEPFCTTKAPAIFLSKPAVLLPLAVMLKKNTMNVC